MTGKVLFEPACNLLRGPVVLQFNRNDPLQLLVLAEQTGLRSRPTTLIQRFATT
jgi:hypothetical protein